MISARKNLRAGRSVWSAYPLPKIPVQILKKDTRTDVAIIGAGISGALMAERLTAEGSDVVILDRRGPMKGSTFATTALLQYELDQPLTKLSKMIGFDDAARAWRRTKQAINSLYDRTHMLDIRCGMTARRSFYLAGDLLPPDALKEEGKLRRAIGIENRFMTAAAMGEQGIKKTPALESFDSYVANPYQLTEGYLATALARGARIFSPVTVQKIETAARRVYLETDQGISVTAKHLVFCTGYEVPKQLAGQDFQIFSTFALATPKGIVDKMTPMLWEAASPYLYLRPTPDGRVICGGEDEEFSDEDARNALLPQKTKTILRKMQRLLPQLSEVSAEYSWCGYFGVTPDSLPLIGKVPRLKNTYAVMAFGGNGIANSRIGADIVANHIMGHDDPESDLFAFD